jgi:hypothetical protein
MMAGAESIRDVIAFPKTQRAQCLLTDAPSDVDEKQLRELHIRLRQKVETQVEASPEHAQAALRPGRCNAVRHCAGARQPRRQRAGGATAGRGTRHAEADRQPAGLSLTGAMASPSRIANAACPNRIVATTANTRCLRRAARDRGARRIVTGDKPPVVFYYTADHYKSFRRIQR